MDRGMVLSRGLYGGGEDKKEAWFKLGLVLVRRRSPLTGIDASSATMEMEIARSEYSGKKQEFVHKGC